LKKSKGPYDWFTVQPIQQINNATRFSSNVLTSVWS